MSKRKAPEPTGGKAAGKAAGKRRVDATELDIEQSAEDHFAEAMLGDAADLTEVVDNADALADAIGDGEEADDEDGEDALLAAALAGDDECAEDGDDAEGDAGPEEPALPEPGELPDGVTEHQLSESAEVDLTACGELTLAQARRVAQCLAENDSLTTVKVGSSELPIRDIREEDELEWDSEEYTDVEAIILAELLKANTRVHRLDLARNQIADAGACALAAMLSSNNTIEYLNLESNTFGERGGNAFLDVLRDSERRNSSLQYLNLMYNSVPNSTQAAIRQAWQGANRGVGLHL